MRNILLSTFLSVLFTCSVKNLSAQSDTLRQISDFVKEIQQIEDNNEGFQMAFWLPWQYWETALRQAAKGKPLQATSVRMINTMKNYNVFMVVETRKTGLNTTYPPEQEISDSLTLIVRDSVQLRPLAPSLLPEEMINVIELLKPIMQQSFGEMGQNLHFYVFENLDDNGNTYYDAAREGKFELRWNHPVTFTWRLPLEVLTAPKYCPVDNEKLSGKFQYCPYHGNKLKSTK